MREELSDNKQKPGNKLLIMTLTLTVIGSPNLPADESGKNGNILTNDPADRAPPTPTRRNKLSTSVNREKT